MRRIIYIVILFFLLISLIQSAAVDFTFGFNNELKVNRDFVNKINTGIYVNYSGINKSNFIELDFDLNSIGNFFNFRIKHFLFLKHKYSVKIFTENNWRNVNGIFSQNSFFVTDIFTINNISKIKNIKIRIYFDKYFTGILNNIVFRFYEDKPSVINLQENLDNNIFPYDNKIVVKGIGRYDMAIENKSRRKIEAKRAAKVAAYRNLQKILLSILRNNNDTLKKKEINRYMKGVNVKDVSYKKDFVVLQIEAPLIIREH
ncbi:MAG TPA: hypothetical protein VKN74_05850 [Candidatus Mcinerneyibacterium sp.]|nr:hypothetical protein [Candidatus Mcinerneyibacterium sp.]